MVQFRWYNNQTKCGKLGVVRMSSNRIIEILEDYLAWAQLDERVGGYKNLPQSERKKLRLQYDNDARYYYEQLGLDEEEALKGDTIISFFTPYKRLLQVETGWDVSKTVKSLRALINETLATWDNDYTEKILAVNKRVEGFGEVCYTKGNFMLLPDKNMNIERYPVSEDRIDVTLYECFEGGALAKYFEKGDEGLREWVKREHLELLFNRRVIKRENIKWFQGDEQHHKRISEMNSTELYEYLDRATIFIQYRTRALEQAGL